MSDTAIAEDQIDTTTDQQEEDVEIIDFSQTAKTKKKGKKKAKKSKTANAAQEATAEDAQDKKASLLVAEGHTEYNYQDMLERIQVLLREKNPQSAEGAKLNKSEDPYVVKLGTTKTAYKI